jgi:hypothetical protein
MTAAGAIGTVAAVLATVLLVVDGSSEAAYAAVVFVAVAAQEGVRLGRKAYLVTAAPPDERPLYVALANTIIGAVIIGLALSGVLAQVAGVSAAVGAGRPATRVNWLPRQLKDAPDGLVIEASFINTKTSTGSVWSAARGNPQALLLGNDSKRPPRAFRFALSRPMGTKRGKGERSFVLETRKQAIDFYRELVQNLRPSRASAPKLPDEPPPESTHPAQPDPPAFSAPDARAPNRRGAASPGVHPRQPLLTARERRNAPFAGRLAK